MAGHGSILARAARSSPTVVPGCPSLPTNTLRLSRRLRASLRLLNRQRVHSRPPRRSKGLPRGPPAVMSLWLQRPLHIIARTVPNGLSRLTFSVPPPRQPPGRRQPVSEIEPPTQGRRMLNALVASMQVLEERRLSSPANGWGDHQACAIRLIAPNRIPAPAPLAQLQQNRVGIEVPVPR